MENKNSNNIKEMFNKISSKYIIMNRLMTFGRDRYWRRELVRFANLKNGDSLLDVATGTGEVIKEVLGSKVKLNRCIGLDFSNGMLKLARSRFCTYSRKYTKIMGFVRKVDWIEGNALSLPFQTNSFTVVLSAYLMRNVEDVNIAFTEQYRVLIPGGRVVCLDTTPPGKTLMLPFINFYLWKIIPLLGALISKNKSAYTYLPETTKAFYTAQELKEIMIKIGFKKVSWKKYMFGTIAIHWGEKPLVLLDD